MREERPGYYGIGKEGEDPVREEVRELCSVLYEENRRMMRRDVFESVDSLFRFRKERKICREVKLAVREMNASFPGASIYPVSGRKYAGLGRMPDRDLDVFLSLLLDDGPIWDEGIWTVELRCMLPLATDAEKISVLSGKVRRSGGSIRRPYPAAASTNSSGTE